MDMALLPLGMREWSQALHHRTLISHNRCFRMVGSYFDRQGTCLCSRVSVVIIFQRCPKEGEKEGEISAPPSTRGLWIALKLKCHIAAV
jgi:hypothetical protein